MAKKTKVRRAKVDKYAAKASATKGERDRLVASLPSSVGLPTTDKPNSKSAKKKAPTD